MVVEQRLHLLGARHDERARVAVLLHRILERLPVLEHLIKRLLERELLGSIARDLVEHLLVLVELELEHLVERRRRVGRDVLTGSFGDVLPVPIAHAPIGEAHDEGQLGLKGTDALLERLRHLERVARLGVRVGLEPLEDLDVALVHALHLGLEHLGVDG